MKRAILTPVEPTPAALADLKDWLGIAATRDDAQLADLLRAALETCEAFTGIVPLGVSCEEVLPVCAGWQQLAARPVQAITQVAMLDIAGARTPLAPNAYSLDLSADGVGSVRLNAPARRGRLVVTFTAGLAPDWDSLPEGLHHGIMRLAAYQYRERDGTTDGPAPPASVAALWRPWRLLRLA
jgi:uncharacterized phiE125 gp8 family phage protein